jgi:hypothetical protein
LGLEEGSSGGGGGPSGDDGVRSIWTIVLRELEWVEEVYEDQIVKQGRYNNRTRMTRKVGTEGGASPTTHPRAYELGDNTFTR